MEFLPWELITEIALHLPLHSIRNMCCTARVFVALTGDNSLWRQYYARHYSTTPLCIDTDYRDFIRQFILSPTPAELVMAHGMDRQVQVLQSLDEDDKDMLFQKYTTYKQEFNIRHVNQVVYAALFDTFIRNVYDVDLGAYVHGLVIPGAIGVLQAAGNTRLEDSLNYSRIVWQDDVEHYRYNPADLPYVIIADAVQIWCRYFAACRFSDVYACAVGAVNIAKLASRSVISHADLLAAAFEHNGFNLHTDTAIAYLASCLAPEVMSALFLDESMLENICYYYIIAMLPYIKSQVVVNNMLTLHLSAEVAVRGGYNKLMDMMLSNFPALTVAPPQGHNPLCQYISAKQQYSKVSYIPITDARGMVGSNGEVIRTFTADKDMYVHLYGHYRLNGERVYNHGFWLAAGQSQLVTIAPYTRQWGRHIGYILKTA